MVECFEATLTLDTGRGSGIMEVPFGEGQTNSDARDCIVRMAKDDAPNGHKLLFQAKIGATAEKISVRDGFSQVMPTYKGLSAAPNKIPAASTKPRLGRPPKPPRVEWANA